MIKNKRNTNQSISKNILMASNEVTHFIEGTVDEYFKHKWYYKDHYLINQIDN